MRFRLREKRLYPGRTGSAHKLTPHHSATSNVAKTAPRSRALLRCRRPGLCRRLVASVYVFEELIALDRDAHAVLARWYETLYAERGAAAAAAAAAGGGARRRLPRSARDALMGFFLALKGESVLASINGFEMMRRASSRATNAAEAGSAQHGDEVSALSDVLNAIMSLNIFEVSTVARRTHANTRASASARRPLSPPPPS